MRILDVTTQLNDATQLLSSVFALSCISQLTDMRWYPPVAFAVYAFVLCLLTDLPSVNICMLRLVQPTF